MGDTPTDSGEGEDLSWLNQYYTPEKSLGPTTGELESTIVTNARAAGAPAPEGVALTSLASAKYEVIGSVGAGGMKVVRSVRDRDTTRTVAMATIRGELESREMVARFVREARITALLEHPNIVPVHDLGTDAAGRPYFTMKMLEGESLQEILKKIGAGEADYASRYNLAALLDIFKKVCSALAFAHSRGVVHLDLKPSNIHVSRFGEVLVLDWGLAKYVGEADEEGAGGVRAEEMKGAISDLTLPGAVKGTLGFMAPEQARGENSRKDKRTDVYALGAILYALLTLKAPPSSDTVETVLADTMAGRIVPPRRRAPERAIPAALEAVAMKALAVAPEKRYQSAEDLVRDVEAFMGGYATSAQDVGILTLLWLLIKRHKIRVSLSALVLLLLAGTAGVSLVRIRASERMAVEALAKFTAEQEENRRLSIDAAPQVLRRAEKYMRELRVEDAVRELDVAVTLDSSLAVAWMGKGFLQLARQDFAGALKSFQRAPAAQKPVAPGEKKKETAKAKGDRKVSEPEALAEKYLRITDGGRRPLSLGEFREFAAGLAQALGKGSGDLKAATLYQTFLLWNQAHGGEPETRRFCVDFLRTLNPKAENPGFEMTEVEGGVKLVIRGGRGVSVLSSLAGLQLIWLDLSGTGVTDLGPLQRMPLEYLDLTGTMVRDITPVAGAPLRELRVDGKSLDVEQLARLTHLERLVLSKETLDPKHDSWIKGRGGLDVSYK